jgi:hypothetical protein
MGQINRYSTNKQCTSVLMNSVLLIAPSQITVSNLRNFSTEHHGIRFHGMIWNFFLTLFLINI